MQRYPAHGKFYEHDQLIVHRQLIPKEGMAIIDVGSNIGNHALFYSVHTDARKFFCFEPSPIACALLRKNVEINSETKIDLTYAEYGCGDGRQRCRVVQMPGNLGGATLKADDSGDGLVDVMPLDSLLLKGADIIHKDRCRRHGAECARGRIGHFTPLSPLHRCRGHE